MENNNSGVEEIEKIEIDINKNEEEKQTISLESKNELIEYLADAYQINKENIIIN